MALLSTNIATGTKEIGSGFLAFLARLAELSPTYRRITYYNSKSDAQLAEMGLRREDIPAKVLGPRMFV
ncbi:hypothetical protein [Roseinatronobacter sp. NSM]|uniref:hypothetical protein n=1 Tax=Roseinatronobacter sp. NSM TaxID=3457785 RepID=UPI0040373F53